MIEYRPWGLFKVLYQDETTWLKRLRLDAGAKLSLQYHRHRREFWLPESPGGQAVIETETIDLTEGIVYNVSPWMAHRIINPTDDYLYVLEWAVGNPDENDIERLQDDYGR